MPTSPHVETSQGVIQNKLESAASPASVKKTDVKEFTTEALSSKKSKNSCLQTKTNPLKKAKRFSPYGSRPILPDNLDESNLMETPVLQAKRASDWAVVACPNKPPFDK